MRWKTVYSLEATDKTTISFWPWVCRTWEGRWQLGVHFDHSRSTAHPVSVVPFWPEWAVMTQCPWVYALGRRDSGVDETWVYDPVADCPVRLVNLKMPRHHDRPFQWVCWSSVHAKTQISVPTYPMHSSPRKCKNPMHILVTLHEPCFISKNLFPTSLPTG